MKREAVVTLVNHRYDVVHENYVNPVIMWSDLVSTET